MNMGIQKNLDIELTCLDNSRFIKGICIIFIFAIEFTFIFANGLLYQYLDAALYNLLSFFFFTLALWSAHVLNIF